MAKNNDSKWVTIAALWKNDDGRITVTMNEELRAGEKLFFVENRYKKSDTHPDMIYAVPREKYDKKNREVLRD